jgi:hypothetical protein
MHRMQLIYALFALAGTGFEAAHAQNSPAPVEPAAFSRMARGASLAPWMPITIMLGKRPTHYDLVGDDGAVVLHAIADNAASGLGHAVQPNLRDTPFIAWRWKVADVIKGADSSVASREDAPARVVLEFDGDKSKLTLLERGIYRITERVSGRELPYATLMYIWGNHEPVGSVMPNPRTRRIQMIVVSSGAAGAGNWQSVVRDVRADFRRAFGEEPGRLFAVGVLTDSDNTDGHAEAWYGDIRFVPGAP